MKNSALALAVLASGAVAGPAESAQPLQRDVEHWESPPHYPSPWMNPEADGWQDAYQKAKDFVSQLTLLEKVNITTGVGWQGGPCLGNTGSVPRLGFKGFCNQDSPLGIRHGDYSSAFSSGLNVAATFDRSLLYRRGKAMGEEHKAKGVTVQLGPVAGPLGRMPEGGRGWEGFATDPVLTGVSMAETINGIQDAGVIACAKHYIFNEQEHFRQVPEAHDFGYDVDETLSSNVDDKTLHELYLWPFADAVRAGVGSVMCSYQQTNNSYGCANSKLLNGVLKDELGFQGFVMSDWQAQHTGVASSHAGLDMTMPGDTLFSTGGTYFGTNLTVGILNGTVPEWRVDDMAMRVMASFFKVGNTVENQPEPNLSSWTKDTYGYKYNYAKEGYEQVNWHVDVRQNHGQLIREIGSASTVLLKNEGVLPLNKPKFVAVVGEDAGPNPNGPNGCDNRGCDDGTLAMGWGSGTADYPYLITPDSALQRQVVEDGGRYESILDNYAHDKIDALVGQPDATCLVFTNSDAGEGFLSVDGNEGDRNNLTLWKNGDDLIKQVSSECNNTIVVMHSVGPVLVTDWYEHENVTAIIWAGLPGEQSGNSLVDVLYGKQNPSGRTPFTWAKKREDYGTDVMYEPNDRIPQQEFSEGVYIDYRHFDKEGIEPAYEFGFGLSYTTFEYSDIKVKASNPRAYEPTQGKTIAAPSFGGNFSKNLKDYAFPTGWKRIDKFIYPYLFDTSSLEAASDDDTFGQTAEEFLPEGALDGSAQPLLPSSGKNYPGGNRQLYDTMYEVFATVTNTGDIVGDEIVQMYVDLGGDNPPRQLRDFGRIRIEPGQSAQFRGVLTRRDLANWDVVSQDWVVTDDPKKVYIGSSSRKLPLSADLA